MMISSLVNIKGNRISRSLKQLQHLHIYNFFSWKWLPLSYIIIQAQNNTYLINIQNIIHLVAISNKSRTFVNCLISINFQFMSMTHFIFFSTESNNELLAKTCHLTVHRISPNMIDNEYVMTMQHANSNTDFLII